MRKNRRPERLHMACFEDDARNAVCETHGQMKESPFLIKKKGSIWFLKSPFRFYFCPPCTADMIGDYTKTEKELAKFALLDLVYNHWDSIKSYLVNLGRGRMEKGGKVIFFDKINEEARDSFKELEKHGGFLVYKKKE